MKISCPACGFCREVAPDRIPAGPVVATCPKCGEKFRLAPTPETQTPPGGEEEDIRQLASRAYETEARRFSTAQNDGKRPENANSAIVNPWDIAPEPSGWATAFFQTVSRVMFSASRFFGALQRQGGLLRPLGFYVILLLLQTIMDRLWGQFFLSVLAPGASSDPQLEKLLQLLVSDNNIILGILFRCGAMIFQLYVFALIIYCAYRFIAPGKSSYELIFQILAYSSAPLVLCIVPVLGSLAGMIWSVGCLLVGCKAALSLDWIRTLLGFLPVIFLMAPVFSLLFNLLGA